MISIPNTLIHYPSVPLRVSKECMLVHILYILVLANLLIYVSSQSGERGKLMISAAPAIVGVHTSELLFCVKDNPEVIKITITCTGIVPVVEILPINKIIGML